MGPPSTVAFALTAPSRNGDKTAVLRCFWKNRGTVQGHGSARRDLARSSCE